MKYTPFFMALESSAGHCLNTHPLFLPHCMKPITLDWRIRDNKYHATIRKAVNPAFSPAALKELEPLIKKRMDEFINSIETVSKRNAGTVNMSEWFENLAFSVRKVIWWRW